ncbi:MAG: FAD-binding and (Fe-S)-binding domain-containing protein, partial [Bacteroidota bacterium]|nr:FAD-binding oxidoreductase [Candidatus Kapabacteria bacterium]MDW8221045.1 FAD-binding and (Fe-S)-binding domain-containing protein [Bacteroidota bacterium]
MEYTDVTLPMQPELAAPNNIHIAQELMRFLRPDQVLTRPIERIAYAHDASCYRLVPQAIVRPETLDDVRQLMAWANATRTPLTFRAAGTSLSGQAITTGVIVDITRGAWDSISISPDGSIVRVGPGMIGSKVNAYLRKYGRKIGPDPASLSACMIGGIVANNASGMCCGVAQNSYHTLESLVFMLPNGVLLDSADPDANNHLRHSNPQIAEGLLALQAEIRSNPSLVEKIRRKYKIKNTIGYSINAFLDFNTPVEILRHLMVGSEGTLGFIAQAGFYTVPDLSLKSTALLFFQTVADACASIVALRDSGAAALELMDYACLAAMRDQYGAPRDIIDTLPPTAACLLVEYQSDSTGHLQRLRRSGEALLPSLRVLAVEPFTEDPHQQAIFWKLRKGIIPVVSAKRCPGTTVINEDIAFPIEHLADGVVALQELFVKHGYPDGVIFGHAKDGNLHFTLAQSFHTDADVAQFAALLDDIAQLVVGRFDGSLKAEHGTGRNMAPYVEMEWGKDAYTIMRKLKALIDPAHILNPGVILNDNPHVHVENLKPIPVVDDEVNTCIECGWCENVCPSQGLTLTPRQRIVVWREITRVRRAELTGEPLTDAPFSASELECDYDYYGVDTCATDGMCATLCPVHINTGNLVKLLRRENHSTFAQQNARTVARHFHLAEATIKAGLNIAHALDSMGGSTMLRLITKTAAKLTNLQLPLWNPHLGTPISLPHTSPRSPDAVYFPACVTRIMGGNSTSIAFKDSIRALISVAKRAGEHLWIPSNCTRYCCGTPFSSKGFMPAYYDILERTIQALWEWSDGGRLPIITDASSCTYTFRN